MKNKKTGFTLIELLVVISIIAILTVAGIVSFSRASMSARDAKRKADLETVRQAMVQYKANREDTGYPIGADDSGTFSAIVLELKGLGYLSAGDIEDPRTGTTGFDYTCNPSCTTSGFTITTGSEKNPAEPISVSNP